jgi:hypothetical protein
MTRSLTIRRVLAALALLGMILAPLARPAMAMDSGAAAHGGVAAHATMDMADMPCCPDEPPMPGCGKDCPWMAVCSTLSLYDVPRGALLVRPVALASVVAPPNEAAPSGLTQRPPPRPPKI